MSNPNTNNVPINTNYIDFIPHYLEKQKASISLESLFSDPDFYYLLEAFRSVNAFSMTLKEEMGEKYSNQAIAILRKLKSAYSLPIGHFFLLLSNLVEELGLAQAEAWSRLSLGNAQLLDANMTVSQLLKKYNSSAESLIREIEKDDPHAVYPTSIYRTSSGKVNSNREGTYIEAVMTTSTMTEIQIVDEVLNPANNTLKQIYEPHRRCICVVDTNINEHYGQEIISYFEQADIDFVMLVYRAMEVDKGIRTVEQLLSDFKCHGVSRQEPVLVVGGGVITDTAGLACALYHRGTPYVMLATSIVSGIDAGPSPRTCCDGFGFKNLFGAYHAPILTLTDRTFFKTLHPGWIRHGVAEMIKMAVVKDAELFHLLEQTGVDLLLSRFGSNTDDQDLKDKGKYALALAMKSYVQAEYGNLYETHQCRPHAYGHTWSPGYEIPSGMLHGHAISCGMGFGAQLSYQLGWISEDYRDRILRLISSFELSLWHPILDDIDLIYSGQVKIIEKRGGNLVAPLPINTLGECGYLNELSLEDLKNALMSYKKVAQTYPRKGLGIDPHCEDVGLENPATVGRGIAEEKEMASLT